MKLRYYQRQAIDAFFDHVVKLPKRNPLIVLPTGTGKSLVNADIVKTVVEQGARPLCITHQKTLIRQNYDEFTNLVGMADVGIFSAGLKRRETENRIIFAGIQSVYKKAYYLGRFDLIIVDEAHLIPQKSEGMYRKFFSDCKVINPKLIILGLTATPYRLKGGMLTHGTDAIFHDIIHETSIAEMVDENHYMNLDNTRYLTRLTTKPVENKADMKGVKIQGGDYVEREMEKRFMADDLVNLAVAETIEKAVDRNKVLIFTAGIEHAQAVFDLLPPHDTGLVTSKQSPRQNDKATEDFSSGQIKYLVNVNMLTTGYNEKAIDCIVLMRKTVSPGLYVQMPGRGTRLYPGKENCLVLDFGGNIDMHGPIDKIDIRNPTKNKDKEDGAPIKSCPGVGVFCGSIVHISTRVCPDCGYEFPEPERHEPTASEQPILSERKEPETYEVTAVMYSRHKKEGRPDSMKVTYCCGRYIEYRDWICLDHGGLPAQSARGFLELCCPPEVEVANVDEMLKVADVFFKKPTHIKIDDNDKFPRVVEYALPDEFPVDKKEVEKYMFDKEFDKEIEKELADIPF